MQKQLTIEKINRSNLSKQDKKQLIECVIKGDNEGLLKKLFYSFSISDKILDFFDIDINDYF
jgi:hypothetical protein